MSEAQNEQHLDALIKEYKALQPKFKIMAKHAKDLYEKHMSKQIPAILSQRCKDTLSLKDKMQTKYFSGRECQTFVDVQKKYEIPDLAAMRIALYYPNQNKEVESFLKGIFKITSSDRPRKGSGYIADHYTVQFKEDEPKSLKWPHDVLFYQEEQDVVEVQVVSVLFHTWAQVEHKIKYKRDAYTPLSLNEQRILEGLRGLVGSGDLLLEELYEHQRQNTRVFEDEYELGSWLWKNIPKDSPLCMGDHRASDQKVLFTFLNIFEVNTPNDLGQFLKQTYPHDKTHGEEIRHKLDTLKQKYRLPELRTSICLMDPILSAVGAEKSPQIVENAITNCGKNELAYKCRTVLNALNWFHELFDQNTDEDQLTTILIKYQGKGKDEEMSLKWAYNNICRGDIADKPGFALKVEQKKRIEDLWNWMEQTDEAALELVFKIAKCGVWHNPTSQLLKQLGNRFRNLPLEFS